MTRSVRIAVVLALFAAAGCSSDAGDLVVTRVADLKPVPFAELRERIAETNRQLVDELADGQKKTDEQMSDAYGKARDDDLLPYSALPPTPWSGPCDREACEIEDDNDSGSSEPMPSEAESLNGCGGHEVYVQWRVSGAAYEYQVLLVDGPEIAGRFIAGVGTSVRIRCGGDLRGVTYMGDPPYLSNADLTDGESRILEYVRSDGPVSVSAIASHVDFDERPARRALERLEDLGLIVRRGSEWDGRFK